MLDLSVAVPSYSYAVSCVRFLCPLPADPQVSVKAPDGSLRVEAMNAVLPPFARSQLQEMRSATLHSPMVRAKERERKKRARWFCVAKR